MCVLGSVSSVCMRVCSLEQNFLFNVELSFTDVFSKKEKKEESGSEGLSGSFLRGWAASEVKGSKTLRLN